MFMYFAPQGFTSELVKAGRARNGGNVLGLTDVPQFCKHRVMVPHEQILIAY